MSDLTFHHFRPGNFFLGRQHASEPYAPIMVRENLRQSIFLKHCNQPLKEPFMIALGENPRTKRPFSDYVQPMPLTYDALRDLRLSTSQQQESVVWLKLPAECGERGRNLLVRYDISRQQPPMLCVASPSVETPIELTPLDGVHHLQNLIFDLTGVSLESLTMR